MKQVIDLQMPVNSKKVYSLKTLNNFKYSVETEVDEKVCLDTILDDGKEVVLFNDDHNTFDFVIDTLIDLCKHNEVQAEQCAVLVHFKGQCSVKKGDYDSMLGISREMNRRGLSSVVK
jgi:ATP-dependent Clp protease adaptor protein ClpS